MFHAVSIWLAGCHLFPFIFPPICWHPLVGRTQRSLIVNPGLLLQVVAMCVLASSANLWPGPGLSSQGQGREGTVAVHSRALVFVEESGVTGAVLALLASVLHLHSLFLWSF